MATPLVRGSVLRWTLGANGLPQSQGPPASLPGAALIWVGVEGSARWLETESRTRSVLPELASGAVDGLPSWGDARYG